MVTLRILEPLSFKTPDVIISKQVVEVLSVNNVQFALSLVEANKAALESSSHDMVELMAELLHLDHIIDSDLYLDERIRGSEAVVQAYRTGTKQQFIEQALLLIKVYLRCQREEEK